MILATVTVAVAVTLIGILLQRISGMSPARIAATIAIPLVVAALIVAAVAVIASKGPFAVVAAAYGVWKMAG